MAGVGWWWGGGPQCFFPSEPPPADPNIRQALEEAQAVGGGKWPGANLPDIGQLTAQASRIATDIATGAARVQSAFHSQAVIDLRRSLHDFRQFAYLLAEVPEHA